MELPPDIIHKSPSFSGPWSPEASVPSDNFMMSSRSSFCSRSLCSSLILASSTSSTPSGTTSSASSSTSSSSSEGYVRLLFLGLHQRKLYLATIARTYAHKITLSTTFKSLWIFFCSLCRKRHQGVVAWSKQQ